ncbi:hypothetical protein EVA_20107 [gut metagenome]|uniref:Uncharacterized protein n=1 Tax=gut metagenome TaxID=749906 RepID=J9FQC1_9ZZZZ
MFWNSGRTNGLESSTEEATFTRKDPSFPFFVLIKITPLAALAPYKAAADGPVNTEMLSISSGLKFAIPSLEDLLSNALPSPSRLAWLPTGIPSIT